MSKEAVIKKSPKFLYTGENQEKSNVTSEFVDNMAHKTRHTIQLFECLSLQKFGKK